ncbi:TrlF family AAA-like ATPase [Chloroflexota bacterium]
MNLYPSCRFDKRGSLWHKWDLHFHTPSSYEYDNKSVTNEDIIDNLLANDVDAVAITDHHTMDVDRIKKLNSISANRITIFPGIEFRDEHGDKPIHYICIFPEDCDLDHVWDTIKGKFGLTQQGIRDKGGNDRVYVPIKQGAEVTWELGGVISIHAGAKSNSIEGINNTELFQQRIKYDITNQFVDLMEIGQLKDIPAYLDIVFPNTGLEKPLIICSDCHNAVSYSIKVPLWVRADPTFRGLLMALREPIDRFFIGEKPPQLLRIEQNPTKYIRSVSITPTDGAHLSEKWFNDTIDFNPGLIAIVGNKGSGKSALSDTIGLLGNSKNTDSFSFLCSERFCHPIAGHATHYKAILTWASGDQKSVCLADCVNQEEVELVKYLPQNHVEKICNELAVLREGGFEEELGAVIFSHVPEEQRLGYSKLSDLLVFRTGEKEKRIDSLLAQIKELSRERAILEEENNQINRRSVRKQIVQKEQELEAHDRIKPPEIPNPADTSIKDTANEKILEELKAAQQRKNSFIEEIEKKKKILSESERKFALAVRLGEMLDNFQKDFKAFKNDFDEEAKELGIKAEPLISLTINLESIEKVKVESNSLILDAKGFIEDKTKTGVQHQLQVVSAQIEELNTKLDAPNKAYQDYVRRRTEWQEQRQNIIGNKDEIDSLEGLKNKLNELDLLPQKIEGLKNKQIELALEIHAEKMGQVTVYRELYHPVQAFIDSHELAQESLKMEFHAELTNEGFDTGLLNLLALNRKGSFMGIDEGHSKAREFTQRTKWDDAESVKTFLEDIDKALHEDQREKPATTTQLKDQLPKGVKADQVFNFVYGLDYIRPKYILKWEGKDLEMLSPGERGTLLLVFYLLIEKGNVPLIIDQPEGNLDNLTIAQVLVACIKAARNQRQVFIVTHNPNLAVVCDADQVVYAEMNKNGGTSVQYYTGSLENPDMSVHVTDVLEGTRRAFGVRGNKYEAAQDRG